MNGTRWIVVSATVMRDGAGRVLGVRKRGTSRFMLPGGKPETGEPPLETALRETREELGITLASDGLVPLGTFESATANEPDHRLRSSVFLATAPITGTPAPMAEIAETRWFTLRELAERDDIAPMLSGHVLPALLAYDADCGE